MKTKEEVANERRECMRMCMYICVYMCVCICVSYGKQRQIENENYAYNFIGKIVKERILCLFCGGGN